MMPREKFDIKYEILIKEWEQAQSSIGRFDTITFQIRSWAITTITGMFVASATLSKPNIMLFGIVTTLIFWINDSLQKSFQRIFIVRSREIVEYLSGDEFEQDIVGRKFSKQKFPVAELRFCQDIRSELSSMLKTAVFRNVLFIYGPLIVFCLLAYFVLSNT